MSARVYAAVPLRALGGFDVFPVRPFYLNPSSHNSASLPGAATPILSTKCPLKTAGQHDFIMSMIPALAQLVKNLPAMWETWV